MCDKLIYKDEGFNVWDNVNCEFFNDETLSKCFMNSKGKLCWCDYTGIFVLGNQYEIKLRLT